jgi:hypothetical protein
MKLPAALAALLCALGAVLSTSPAQAYVVNISRGPEAVYLRVGDGDFSNRTYANGGTPRSGGAISLVSVTVPQAVVGNGVSQLMTGNGRTISDWDGYQFCNAGQIYIGGFYRRDNNGNVNATLQVTAPPFLSNGSGDDIPINQISWTTSGNGDFGGQPIPSRTFQAGTSNLATNFTANTWRESCMTFRYANSNVVRGGTYSGRVVYTLTVP